MKSAHNSSRTTLLETFEKQFRNVKPFQVGTGTEKQFQFQY